MNDAQKPRRRERWVATALLFCICVVCVWSLLAARSRSGFKAFRLTGAELREFQPGYGDWYAERVNLVQDDPIEPNILAHDLRLRYLEKPLSRQPVFVRLVHGYNMRDCMRIKGYGVELLDDNRTSAPGSGEPVLDGRPALQTTHRGRFEAREDTERLPPYQLWRLTSSTGDVSIWVTSMLRATDFSPTGVDVRDMAFPRVDVPDAQGWAPRGFSLSSLRHPIRNVKRFVRAKWNASRSDLLTFLGLRQPAWASDEVLTLVSAARLAAKNADQEELAQHVLRAHAFMARQYHEWRTDSAP